MHQCFLSAMPVVYPDADEGVIPDIQLVFIIRNYAAGWVDHLRSSPNSQQRVAKWQQDYAHVFDPNWMPDESWKWWLMPEVVDPIESGQGYGHDVPQGTYTPPPQQRQQSMPDMRAALMQGAPVPTGNGYMAPQPRGNPYGGGPPPVDPAWYQHGEGMLGDPNFEIGPSRDGPQRPY